MKVEPSGESGEVATGSQRPVIRRQCADIVNRRLGAEWHVARILNDTSRSMVCLLRHEQRRGRLVMKCYHNRRDDAEAEFRLLDELHDAASAGAAPPVAKPVHAFADDNALCTRFVRGATLYAHCDRSPAHRREVLRRLGRWIADFHMARAPSIHPPEQGTYPVSRHVARIEGLIADLRGAGHRADADCLARGLAALESPAHEVEGMPVDIVTALGDPNFKNFRVGPTGLTCVDVQVAGRQPAVHTLALAMLRARLLSPASGCDAAGVRDDWHALLSGYGALHAPPVAQRVALLCRALIFHGNRWSAPPVIRTRLGSYIDLLVTTDPLAG